MGIQLTLEQQVSVQTHVVHGSNPRLEIRVCGGLTAVILRFLTVREVGDLCVVQVSTIPPIKGHLGGFQFGVIMNKAATNICV